MKHQKLWIVKTYYIAQPATYYCIDTNPKTRRTGLGNVYWGRHLKDAVHMTKQQATAIATRCNEENARFETTICLYAKERLLSSCSAYQNSS